ncbi:MAG: Calx-beta domain-containing protein, partial [Verrucomicrobiia bacterium]
MDINFDALNAGFNVVSGIVKALAVRPLTGKILVGGSFTLPNAPSDFLVQLTPGDRTMVDPITMLPTPLEGGFVDTNFFTIGTNYTLNGQVLALELDRTGADDQVLIGGDFTSVGTVDEIGYIARLNDNGTLDPRINFGSGANAPVRSIDTHPTDPVIAVGGEFTSFNGITRNRYALLVGGENDTPGKITLISKTFSVNEDVNNTPIEVTAGGNVLEFATVVVKLFGPLNDIKITAANRGALLNNVQVKFDDDGGITDGSATATYTSFNNTLLININSGTTTAQTVTNAITTQVNEFDAVVNEGGDVGTGIIPLGAAEITLRRIGGLQGMISISFDTMQITATPGNDFLETDIPVDFAEGESQKTIFVPIIDDPLLHDPSNGGAPIPPDAFQVDLSGLAADPITTATVSIIDTDSFIGFE